MRKCNKIVESTNFQYILDNVSASLAVEGLQASQQAKEITKKYLQGKYTSSQAVFAIKLIYFN